MNRLIILATTLFLTACIAPEYNPIVNKDIAQLNNDAEEYKDMCPSFIGQFSDLLRQAKLIETQVQYRQHSAEVVSSLKAIENTIQSTIDVGVAENGIISKSFCENSLNNITKETDRLLKAYNTLEGIK